MIKAGKTTDHRTGQYEFDTGAQVLTTNKLWRLTNLRPGRTITACNGTKTTAVHEGTLKIRHNGRDITLKNVMYQPSFYNLISGQKLKDLNVLIKGTITEVHTNGDLLYKINRDSAGTLWIKPDDKNSAEIKRVTLMDLHKRYGHISFDTLKSLPEGQKFHGKTAPKCEACIAGKSVKPSAKPSKGSNGQTKIRSEQPLERIHADLIGPFHKEWLGKKYVLTAMDAYTRYCTAIPIKAKSDTKGALREWVKMLENQCKTKVIYLQADWGGEFRNTDLISWCKKKGIQMKVTVPRHSETNAIIERLNRTLQDMARTAMISSGLKLWGDAIQWAAYTKNRIPHKSIKQSPIEKLLGKQTNRSNLRPFGQRVMVHLYKEERGKDRMAPRAIEARITGYTATHDVYQVITTSGRRQIAKNPRPINQSRDSDEEDETIELQWPKNNPIDKAVEDLQDIANGQIGRNYNLHCPEKEECPKGTHDEYQTPEGLRTQSPNIDSPSQHLFREQNDPPGAPTKPKNPEPRRSERMGRDVTNWQDRIKQGLAGGSFRTNRVRHDDDHPTDEQARSHPTKAHEWAKARDTECQKLQKYGVYTIVQKHEIPEDLQPVDTKWVYDDKKDSASNIIRYRARKVGRGFTQEYGLNYHETFSQMARSESWRILLTLAINCGWEVLQWDVKAAYLQADLSHEMNVKDLTEKGETEYWKLHKALYGLKQAGHEWYNRMRSIMTTAGLQQCIGDPGCFKGPVLIVSTHVDDMAGYGTLQALQAFEKAVEKEVKLEKLGKPTKLLGMEIEWGPQNSWAKLTQRDSIDKLTKEYAIPVLPNRSIPLNLEGYAEPTETELINPTKYQSLVGSLLYINRMTRPDISVHVNLLGRRTSKPGIHNMRTALQVGQYLASTKNEGLLIMMSQREKPEALINIYADASYGGENSRSQSGSLVMLYGSPIMWNSRWQEVVSMSITEAEYIACSEAAKDAQWIKQLLSEVGKEIKPTLHTDNEAALKLTKTQTFHRRTRHIEHRFHYIRELVDQGLIQITGIKGKNNPADPLTKLLPMSSIGQWKTAISIG